MNHRFGLGQRIVLLRHESNLSRHELSLLSTVNYTTLMNIENGRTVPRLETLDRLSKTLGVAVKALLEDGENNESKHSARRTTRQANI